MVRGGGGGVEGGGLRMDPRMGKVPDAGRQPASLGDRTGGEREKREAGRVAAVCHRCFRVNGHQQLQVTPGVSSTLRRHPLRQYWRRPLSHHRGKEGGGPKEEGGVGGRHRRRQGETTAAATILI